MKTQTYAKQGHILITTYDQDDIILTDETTHFISQTIFIGKSDKFSLFIKNDSSLTVTVLDNEVTELLSADQVIATGTGTVINLNKLLGDAAYSNMRLKIEGELNNFLLLLRVSNPFG